MNLYTASWAVALSEPDCQPVRISGGCPKAAKDAPHIGALAPYGLFGKDLTPEQFAEGYRERLDSYGVDAIRRRLERVADAARGKPLLLACYERDPADSHRAQFADWWL